MSKKTLVTGVNGMLGSFVVQELLQRTGLDIYGVGRSERNDLIGVGNYFQLDLLDLKLLQDLLAELSPDVIVHCAAEVNLDRCESDHDYADKIHREVTAVLSACAPAKTRLIYISTDSVFDGRKGNYSEDDEVNPLNYYAMSKFHGEEAVRKRKENYVILRTNIYGFKKNNGNSLFEWIAQKLSKGERITGFDDLIFNPLYVGQLAKVIAELIVNDFSGTLNAGCDDFVSKYQFAVDIANEFGWDSSLIARGNSDMFPSKLTRPKNTTLNVDKLKAITGFAPSLKQGLEQLHKDFESK
jgi:dTDP-4-dehydrorhamnose reductase